MNGIPKPTKAILSALEEVAKAKVALKEAVDAAQASCKHLIVLCYEDREVFRLCPVCGIEERVPHYHSFLHVHLGEHPDRLMVSATGDIYKFRIRQ